MNYLDFVSRLDTLAFAGLDQTQYPVTIPAIIEAAEQRIYREVDFLSTTMRDKSLAMTAGNRELAFTANTAFVTLQTVNLLLAGGYRATLEPVSRDLLDAVYGGAFLLAQPQWFTVLDGATLLVGPWPDLAYAVELVGTIRPVSLSAVGQTGTTFISANLPDLMIAAAMAFVSTFAGGAGEAPSGGSWEAYFQTLKASAVMEDARRKFQSTGWSSLSAPSAATPTR